MDEARLAATRLAFHKKQAALPFEDRIHSVVRMQERRQELAKGGGPPRATSRLEYLRA